MIMQSAPAQLKHETLLSLTLTLLILTTFACASPPRGQIAVNHLTATTEAAAVQTIDAALASEASEPTASTPSPGGLTATATPLPTPPLAHIAPSPTKRATPSGKNQIFALNNLAVQERGGLRVEILRVLIGRKSIIEGILQDRGIDRPFTTHQSLQDVDVLGEIIFRITNESAEMLSTFPHQGIVTIGDEQIDLARYADVGMGSGEDLRSGIEPGATVVSGVWFGIKQQDISGINNLAISFDSPIDKDLKSTGSDFLFELDLSSHIFEPLPSELHGAARHVGIPLSSREAQAAY